MLCESTDPLFVCCGCALKALLPLMRDLAMVVGSVAGAAKDNKDNQVLTVSYHQ